MKAIVPNYADGGVQLYRGDCLDVLRGLPDNSVDAVITDPPYSSGGLFRGDRAAPTGTKYEQSGVSLHRPNFDGDSRDQRSWTFWCSWWLSECFRVMRPSGYCLAFADWRQMPALTDAIQTAGFIWRGVIAWDKGAGARAASRGRFRIQCEYIVWGSKGPLLSPDQVHFGHLPGCFSIPVRQADKHHQTGKPTELMRGLVQCVPPDGVCLDPFMGSGTTGKACIETGRKFIGIERQANYFEIARKRIAETERKAVPA